MFVFWPCTWKIRKIEIWRPAKNQYFLVTNLFEKFQFSACRRGGPFQASYDQFSWSWIELKRNRIELNWKFIELKLNWNVVNWNWNGIEVNRSESNWFEIELVCWNEIVLISTWIDQNWCWFWFRIQLHWIEIHFNWSGLKLNLIEIVLNWIDLNLTFELNWIEVGWNRSNWIELNWTKLKWHWIEIELNWNELNWLEFESVWNGSGMKLSWNWNWSDMSWIVLIWIWIESNWIELNLNRFDLKLSWIELNWFWLHRIELNWNGFEIE